MILREHLLIKLPNSPITYSEGILPPTSLSPNTQLYTRTWSLQNRRKRTHASLLHQPIPIPDVTVTTAPPTALTTQRYIYSALGFAPQHATYLAVHLQQLILPRKCHPFSELYSPHHLSCAFNDTITSAWLGSPQELHHSRIVYTDGSQKPSNQPLTLQPPHLLTSLSTALIFPTLSTANLPWPQRRVIAIKIDFPASSSANNYTAEMLGVAVASSLPGNLPTHIYTDAKGIVTNFNKTITQHISPYPYTTPHLPRNYTETGVLHKHVILNHHRLNLHHIKAHQEDDPSSSKSEHGTGNRLADLIAQNKISEAITLAPNLQLHTLSLEALFATPTHPPILTLGCSDTTYPLPTHHPNTTLQRFLTIHLNDWLQNTRPRTSRMSTLQWSSLTWNLAGTVISTSNASPYYKTFLFKTLYDALPNEYTKYKYSTTHAPDYDPNNDPYIPVCPLCSTSADSLTHLFCNCPDPTIATIREKLSSQLQALNYNTHPSHPAYLTIKTLVSIISDNFISTPCDHRNLLGLFANSQLNAIQSDFPLLRSALKLIANLTIPYIKEVWTKYCSHTHTKPNAQSPFNSNSVNYPPTPRPPRLIILSGNNATMTLTTVNDHPPAVYSSHRSRGSHTLHKSPAPSHTPHRYSSSTPTRNQITTYLTALPSHPSPDLPCTLPQPSPRPASTPPTLSTTNSTTTSNSQFSLPKHPVILHSRTPSSARPTPSPSSQHPLPFSVLEVAEPNNNPSTFTFTHSHLTITPLHHIDSTSMTSILSALKLHAQNVPENGDCFYLTIQFYLLQVHSPPQHYPATSLRRSIFNLLTQSAIGKRILREHGQTKNSAASNILPNFRPSLFPNRDIYASDYVISAMATMLGTPIIIFSHTPGEIPLKYSYNPYTPNDLPPLATPILSPIHLWTFQTHFQLLLPTPPSTPSLTENLLKLPFIPTRNIFSPGTTTFIPTPSSFPILYSCPYQQPSQLPPTSFCPNTCHQYCPNQYSALRNIAFQRSPKNHTASQLIALEAVPPHTPIMEISATINHSQSHTHVTLITPSHHSNAIYTHPILQLMYSDFRRLASLCIPEPSPHLKLFLVTTESLSPYESLRIRPPPEPPPSTIPSRSTDRRSQKTQSTLITSFFQRSSPPLPYPLP